ncbi:TraB/GumN family protein [Kaarinaea lacus]
MKISPKYTIGLTLVVLLFAHSAVQAKSFLWRAQSNNSTVFLMGSIHFAKPDFYPLADVIEQSFAKSSVLVVEINEGEMDKTAMQQMIVDKGLYPENDSIENHISEETLQLLKTYLDKNKMPLLGFGKMKPGFLAMTLSVAHIIKLGYLPQFGIDMYFINKAEKKTILQLESAKEQLELFFSLPNEESFLKHTILQFDTLNEQIDKITTAWKNGDTKYMTDLVIMEPQQDYPDLQQVFKIMYEDRNVNMTNKIIGYLKQPKTYFVVVGAGHLVGEKGIVSLLRKKGYQVEQM